MNGFQFSTTGTLICEPSCSHQLGEYAHSLGIKRLLLVTDPGIKSLGLLDPALSNLESAGIAVQVFSDVVADPPAELIHTGLALAKDFKADGVCGFGGGSSMDVAKVLALLAQSEQSLEDVYGVGCAQGSRLPLLQVPTTAGTGSEVTPIAIITTGETTKQGIVAPQLLPDIALLDASLIAGLPPAITAATGIDAMVHAIEAFTSKLRKNPYSDMLAKEALRLLGGNIVAAVSREGNSPEVCSNMLLGSCLAGQAFANAPVAAVHALAYPLGGHYHIPHGLSNALVLPHVLAFNYEACAEQYDELGAIVAAACGCHSQNLIDAMTYLIDQVALPTTLAAVNVPEADLVMLAADAMDQQRLLVNNPRVLDESDALAIYRAAYAN